MRPIQWHLKNNWRIPESLEKVIPIPRSLHPHLQWWLIEHNVLTGQPLLPIKHANLYRRIKRRVGRSLKLTHCKRVLVATRKQAEYKLSGTKSSLSSLKRVSRPLYRQDGTCGNRQHYSSVLYKQGGRHEVGPTLCPIMQNLDPVYQEASNPKSPTHPRPSECSSRKTIQARPDHSNRMVSPPRGFSNYMQQVAPASSRPICYEVQQQVTSVCVTGTGSPGHSSGCTQSAMGGSRRICLPTSSHLGQSGGEVTGHPTGLPNLLIQPCNQIPHRNLTNLNLWLLESQQSRSRVSLRQWQQEFRLLKGDQPDQSMRQSGLFLQSGASLIRWTSGHPL